MMFQSSPTSKGGRYSCARWIAPGWPGFNPRPPLKVGATMNVKAKTRRRPSFQSSPTSKGGRYPVCHNFFFLLP